MKHIKKIIKETNAYEQLASYVDCMREEWGDDDIRLMDTDVVVDLIIADIQVLSCMIERSRQ